MKTGHGAISVEARRFAAQFAALGHANRVEILRHLLTAHPQGLVVGEIQQTLGIPGSTLSHHLEALRQEGLVTQVREGRFLRYRAGTDALQALLGFLYAECCAGGAVASTSGPLITRGTSSPHKVPPSSLSDVVQPVIEPSPVGDQVRTRATSDDAWKNW